MLNRVFTAVIAIAMGALVLLGYFFPAFAPIQARLLDWAVTLAAAAAIVGVFNLLRVHSDKITRREKGSGYSVLLVLSLLIVFGIGIVSKLPQALGVMQPLAAELDAALGIVLNGIIVPAEAALMGLLVVSLLYAAIRLLRRRADVSVFAFLITAFIVLLGTATLPSGNIPALDVFSRWVAQVWALGGARGILIGAALGALATGLRVLFGIDRPYGGN